MNISCYLFLLIGIWLRIMLMDSSSQHWIVDRYEISTPLTSRKRVVEGLTLYRNGQSPYDGDLYHEMPLTLLAWDALDNYLGNFIKYFFVFIDVLIALILHKIARLLSSVQLELQQIEKEKYHKSAEKLLISESSLYGMQNLVIAIYILNPLSIATCIACSSATINNLAISLVFLSTLSRNRPFLALSIAFATYLSMYPLILVIPCALHLANYDCIIKDRKKLNASIDKSLYCVSIAQTIIAVLSALFFLIYGSFMIVGSWSFLQNTYLFTFLVADLTPNIGIFWYFFTEMFDHFRLFFVFVFQLNVIIYVIPLSFVLHKDPLFFLFLSVALQSIFKSYPSYGDIVLYTSLLPMWRHLIPFTRNFILAIVAFVICVSVGPLMSHLWLEAGSANANFYFAVTLASSTSQIFLITDILFAYFRRRFDLYNGPQINDEKGNKKSIILD